MERSPLVAGSQLGRYEILSMLAAGGMGEVYRARDLRLNRTIALKVLSPGADDRRFEHEARVLAALNHPNIVPVYDVGNHNGIRWIVQELVDGESLRELLKRGPIGLRDFRHLAMQIAAGLAAAHGSGIVHRDLKPENIMVSRNLVVRILDFGVARQVHVSGETQKTVTAFTDATTIVGTPGYMSPEQIEGKTVNATSDIFAFGLVLYEMLTGRPAFKADSTAATLAAVLEKQPTPIPLLVQGIPYELVTMIERCLRKAPEERFACVTDLKFLLEDLRVEPESSQVSSTGSSRARVAVRVGAVVLCCSIAAVCGWLLRKHAPAAQFVLTRLTSDSGLSTDPAISPDGRLLAYASDRSGTGVLDIWVQPIPHGEPVRVTQGEGDSHEPSFSGDGHLIAFRAERDHGGIYVVPTLGGEARRIADGGYRPRFSPDGSRIAFWSVREARDVPIPGLEQIYISPVSGGLRRRFQPEFVAAGPAVWSPDGTKLLFRGIRTGDSAADWWVASLDGGPAIRLGIANALARTDSWIPVPEVWTRDQKILFSMDLGDSTNVWEIAVSGQGTRLNGRCERLTSGSGNEIEPGLAGGRLVFATQSSSIDLWRLPANTNTGEIRGGAERLTYDGGLSFFPWLSADARRMVFQSDRRGNTGTWLKDFRNGRESNLSFGFRSDILLPFLTADGASAILPVHENGASAVYSVPIAKDGSPGPPRAICADCKILWTSSRDGQKLFYGEAIVSHSTFVLDTKTGVRKELLRSSAVLARVRLSPDGKWLAFTKRLALVSQIYVAPYREDGPVAENQWIAVSDGEGANLFPYWSPDGQLLYYYSDRDGNRCVWARRWDSLSGKTIGQSFPVQHFHDTRRSLRDIPRMLLGMGIASNEIVLNMSDTKGKIWMTETSIR